MLFFLLNNKYKSISNPDNNMRALVKSNGGQNYKVDFPRANTDVHVANNTIAKNINISIKLYCKKFFLKRCFFDKNLMKLKI